jgi:hypothetical protein
VITGFLVGLLVGIVFGMFVEWTANLPRAGKR